MFLAGNGKKRFMQLHNNREAFLALVRAGLFPNSDLQNKTCDFHGVDWAAVNGLAESQNVIGLAAAGIDYFKSHDTNFTIPQEWALQFMGSTLQVEQRNLAMNGFIAGMIEEMRKEGIYVILVKGQGLAQCYEKPLWRASGDVDLLLSEDNYKKAKKFLLKRSSGNKPEERYSKHLGMNIDPWYVEIHGTLRTGLSARVDKEVDAAQREVFYSGRVRSWQNGKTQVFLPGVNEDVFFVFTHFIKHFYKEGMTLRQVCDWCRLLWTYKDKLNHDLLESRVKKNGLMNEWKAFAALAVDYLGMPVDAMPFYDERFKRKGFKLIEFILNGYSGNKVKDTWGVAKIFPWKTLCYMPSIFLNVNCLKVKERLFAR